MSHPHTNHEENDSHLKMSYAIQTLVAAPTQMIQVIKESQANNPIMELPIGMQQVLNNHTQIV